MDVFCDINEGDVVFDCGAYVGDITEFFRKKGATVYAFEPEAVLVKILEERFKDNNNVIVINKGAYDSDAKLKFYLNRNYKKEGTKFLEGTSTFEGKINVGKDYVEAEVIDLANFIKNLGKKVKLLKLNVEGCEYRILDKLIDSKVIYDIERVVVAFHSKKIPSLLRDHKALKRKVIKHKLYNTIIYWEWWANNRSVITSIKKLSKRKVDLV